MQNNFPPLPNNLEEAVIKILQQSTTALTKNQLAKFLAVKGEQRVDLKLIIKKLKQQGYADKLTKKKVLLKPQLRPKLPIKSPAIDLRAQQTNYNLANKSHKSAFPNHSHQPHNTNHRLGMLRVVNGRGLLMPCHRKENFPPLEVDLSKLVSIPKQESIVSFVMESPHEASGGNYYKIDKILGAVNNPKTCSLMAIHSHNLPHIFSKDALHIANNSVIPPVGNRTDLRDLPFVTIDGETAQDFDDAVWATADNKDIHNSNGWRIMVAIADVAYYVPFNSALDKEAMERGNSVYFANHVVPMLPENLSNGLCSLKPDEDRACLVVEMKITADGKIKSHHFSRGLMRSRARLTYNQVQRAINGDFDDVTEPLRSTVIEPLYGAYSALLRARNKRGTLDINVPEQSVIFNDDGSILRIDGHKRLESHQLIEEMMIAANVCAAKTLLSRKSPTIFRVHDLPTLSRVDNLKIVLKTLKIKFPKVKKFSPPNFGDILHQVKDSAYQQLINDLVLRSQAQAVYSPKNIGHFGLALSHYCHFTSPIRRYADLVVHRGLIASLNLGEGGHAYNEDQLGDIATHTSSTERKAATAEREVKERLMTVFLESHIGEFFKGTIVGVNGAGLFIRLDSFGAEGFITKSQLPYDFYIYQAEQYRYFGKRTRKVYQLGQAVKVRLDAVNSLLCTTTLSLIDDKDNKNQAAKNYPDKKHPGSGAGNDKKSKGTKTKSTKLNNKINRTKILKRK